MLIPLSPVLRHLDQIVAFVHSQSLATQLRNVALRTGHHLELDLVQLSDAVLKVVEVRAEVVGLSDKLV